MLRNTEFYVTPKGDVMIHTEKGVKKLEFTHREFVSAFFNLINELYPEAVEALSREFEKFQAMPAVFEFMVVRRMIKCNFGKFDSVMDIDQFGNLNFEEVDCPLRGECHLEGIVCKPKFNTKLSGREREVMNLMYRQVPKEDIAECLCLSVETVRTHKRNAFRKVGVHSLAEFYSYAKQHNLFEN